METIEARVVVKESKHFISIDCKDGEISIPICEEKPNEVKVAFNRIIARLQKGSFQIKLCDVTDDLFAQVANEYVTQLNREIQEVHKEILHYDLSVDKAKRIAPEVTAGK